MKKITLTTQLSIADYTKVTFHILYRNFAIKFLTGTGLFMFLAIGISFNDFDSFPWVPLLIAFFFTVGLPLQVYFNARRNYKSNGRINEPVTYELNEEHIELTGESFNSKLTWDKVYSVTENKDWVLIWQNRQVANVLPKRDFNDDELQTFKDLVKLQSRLKNKLKA